MVDTRSPDDYLVSNGSWQLEIVSSVCLYAFIVTCTMTNQELSCTWVEKGEHRLPIELRFLVLLDTSL